MNQSWIDAGSGYQKTVLDNGIRVITEEIPLSQVCLHWGVGDHRVKR